jgi:putative transposon-encoded protein
LEGGEEVIPPSYSTYTVKRVEIELTNQIEIENTRSFFIRKATKFGNGAKVDCPKE